MRRRNIKGEIIEDGLQPKTQFIKLRVTDDEMNRIRLMMERYGYKTKSSFLRDAIFKKKLISKRVTVRVTDEYVINKVNELIYQVNKIGVNYNIVAKEYMEQSRQSGREGHPSPAGRLVEEKMEKLMSMTESLRDEVAAMLDTLKRYLNNM